MSTPPRTCLVAAFTLVIGAVGPLQAILQIAAGERPVTLELFARAPTAANLRDFERNLESRAPVPNLVRPWIQMLDFTLLAEAGDKALVGRDGWLFYRPGVEYLTQAWTPPEEDAGAAIRSFHDQLASRDIRLLVVPVPGKATIYPDRLTSRARDLATPPNRYTQSLMQELRRDGIEALDLTDTFTSRRADGTALYLSQDTHWSPRGLHLAAQAIASRLLDLGWVTRETTAYRLEPVKIQRHGDLVEMMRSPPLEAFLPPEEIECSAVRRDGTAYTDDPASAVLILGDSFLRIYQTDEPGAAGLIAHLAHELGFPLASLVNDGGAATLVRQQLSRMPAMLEGKRVVIWQFVERDVRFGVEGWQDVQLR